MKRSWFFAVYLLGALFWLNAAEVEISIRFFDKRVFYAEDSSGPIYVQLTLSNHGAATYRFKLADDRCFSINFDVRTTTNRALEPSEKFIRKRTQDQLLFFREVALEPGESLSFLEDLRAYVAIPMSGAYIVRAAFYPELQKTKPAVAAETVFSSNYLTLTVNPAPLADPSVGNIIDVESGALLVREKLPPDQVVDYALRARQKSQWEKFFLYLDLESLLGRDPVRQRAWRAESEEGRQRLIAKYREDLKASIVDGDISVIPIDYKIDKTTYGSDEGTVAVSEIFRYGNLTERKLYTYYLKRRDDLWTIYDYSVINLSKE